MVYRGTAARNAAVPRATAAMRPSRQPLRVTQTPGTGLTRNGAANSGQNLNHLANTRRSSMLGNASGTNRSTGYGSGFTGWGNGINGSGYSNGGYGLGFSGWGNGNSGYGYGNSGYGYGNGGYGSGYGNRGGGNGGGNSQYVWVFLPQLGWVMVPVRLLLMLGL